MFGLFRKPAHPHRREDDAVWMSNELRTQGVVASARGFLQKGKPVAVAAHDRAMIRALEAVHGVPKVEFLEFRRVTSSDFSRLVGKGDELRLLLVGPSIDPDGEEKFLAQWKTLPFKVHLQVHYSFNDLEKAGIASAQMRKQLELLGANPNEPIVHRWVTRAIANARRKGRTR